MVRKIQAKLVLRLRAQGLSGRAIARSQGMSRRSVSDVLDAARAVGVGWDDVAGKTDGEVYALLFPGRGERESVYEQPCVCSIESGPCERVDVFHVSGRFWSTSACGEKRTPARPAWTSFPS